MTNKLDYESLKSDLSMENVPLSERTWGNDVAKDRGKGGWRWRTRYTWGFSNVNEIKTTGTTTWETTRERVWPVMVKWMPPKKHVYAFLLFFVCGILPMVFLGNNTRSEGNLSSPPFSGIFEDKIIGCGFTFTRPQNSTVTGIEKLFVLDLTFGSFTFAQAKVIDVAWDVLLGRSAQFLAWWIGYTVFSDALLRAIERHPASFRLFQAVALEGPNLKALWTLVKELWRAKDKRTRALFVVIWISTIYIITIQVVLGAMTGYNSKSISFVSLEGDNNIVSTSDLNKATLAMGTWNETFAQPACLDYTWSYKLSSSYAARTFYCDCQFENGTIFRPVTNMLELYSQTIIPDPIPSCRFNFPGNNQTFREVRSYYQYSREYNKTMQCAHAYDITINNKTYESLDIRWETDAYCYRNKGYLTQNFLNTSRCLPDTANPAYEWGFSTMLSGLFVFFHFGWSIAMYAIWLDAQFNSSLVRSGFKMTPLRAAFAVAEAAAGRLGIGGKALVRADRKEVEQEMYGVKGREGTKLEYEMFATRRSEASREGWFGEMRKRRTGRGKDGSDVEEERLT